MPHMKMYDGELVLDETGAPQPLSEGVGDRVPNQPLEAWNLVITAKDNEGNVSIGGEFVASGGGSPLRPNEQDPRIQNNLCLKSVFVVGAAGDGVSFSYSAPVGGTEGARTMQGVPPGLEGQQGGSQGVVPLFGDREPGDVR